MILDVAATLFDAAKILLFVSTAFIASVFLYASAANAWEARELRRWSKSNHESRERAREIASARMNETRAIPADRDHPLHTLGGRFIQ
jgi:hypothetical protein